VELKLFLAALYILNNDEQHSNFIIRNTYRKINETKEYEKYIAASHFIKFLKAINKKPINKTDEKNAYMYQLFKINNKGRYRIFEFLSTNDELCNKLITKHINK
jgi:hypothetical protein